MRKIPKTFAENWLKTFGTKKLGTFSEFYGEILPKIQKKFGRKLIENCIPKNLGRYLKFHKMCKNWRKKMVEFYGNVLAIIQTKKFGQYLPEIKEQIGVK